MEPMPYWVDWELGEDVRDETRLLQDEQWKSAIADGRGHVSHREAAKLHSTQFIESIQWFQTGEVIVDCHDDKQSRLHSLPPELLRLVFDFACGQGALVIASLARRATAPIVVVDDEDMKKSFRLVARKRPLLDFELAAGEYDSANTDCVPHKTTLTLHDGRLARNGRRLTMTHRSYCVDSCVGQDVDNVEFVENECGRILNHMTTQGASTMLFFGQTGTGKTYSFSACLGWILSKLQGRRLRATFYEIHGRDCYDLFADRKKVYLRADEAGTIHVRGAKTVEDDLWTALSCAMKLRSSQATERNPLSSRSHAVLLLEMVEELSNVCNAGAGSEQALCVLQRGSVRLVDLAGSERNYETTKMTAKQHRESADINLSLCALKDCFVAAHNGQRIPHRAHLLTRVLQDCFAFNSPASTSKSTSTSTSTTLDSALASSAQQQPHMTTVIATLSPSPTDLLHTINTLDHAVMLNPDLECRRTSVTVELPRSAGSPLSHIAVEHWSAENVKQWLATAENGRFAALALPPGMVGSDLMRLNQTSLTALFAGQLRKSRIGEEGEAWVVDAGTSDDQGTTASASRTSVIGRSLWAALRRETNSAQSKAKTMQFL